MTAAAKSVTRCKDIIESLGKTPQKGGQYPDDLSGCTYHPGQQGWFQVMAKGGKSPLCSETNGDPKRQRVCACKSSENGECEQKFKSGLCIVSSAKPLDLMLSLGHFDHNCCPPLQTACAMWITKAGF